MKILDRLWKTNRPITRPARLRSAPHRLNLETLEQRVLLAIMQPSPDLHVVMNYAPDSAYPAVPPAQEILHGEEIRYDSLSGPIETNGDPVELHFTLWNTSDTNPIIAIDGVDLLPLDNPEFDVPNGVQDVMLPLGTPLSFGLSFYPPAEPGEYSTEVQISHDDQVGDDDAPFTFTTAVAVVTPGELPEPGLDLFYESTPYLDGATISLGEISYEAGPQSFTFDLGNAGPKPVGVQLFNGPLVMPGDDPLNAIIPPAPDHDTFSIEVDPTVLSDGFYTETITIDWAEYPGQAQQDPFTFDVSFTVTAPPLYEPDIVVFHDITEIEDDQQTPVDLGDFGVDKGIASFNFEINNQGFNALNLSGAESNLVTMGAAPAPIGAEQSELWWGQIDAPALGVGVYNDTVSIFSNDPDENPFEIPVTFEITAPVAERDIAVRYDSSEVIDNQQTPVDLGSFRVDHGIASFNFSIANTGDEVLSLVGGSGELVSMGSLPSSLDGQQSELWWGQIDVATLGVGRHNDLINLVSNDPDENPFEIPVTFEITAPPPPDIQLWTMQSDPILPDGTLTLDVMPINDGPVLVELDVYNAGPGPLDSLELLLPGGFAPDDPLEGPLNQYGADMFSFSIDPTFFGLGLQSETVTVVSNDPDDSPFSFTVDFQVTPPPAPEIEVWHSGSELQDGQGTIDLGPMQLDDPPQEVSFEVRNVGTADLTTSGWSGLTATDVDPLADTIAPEGWDTFTIALDPAEYGEGYVYAAISIANNDADENPFNIPVMFEVTPPPAEPDIAVLYDSAEVQNNQEPRIDLGQVLIGLVEQEFTFTVENVGDAPLHMSSMGLPVYSSITDSLLNTLEPGASDAFSFTLQPASYGNGVHQEQIMLNSDDPDESPFFIPLTFEVVTGPDIAVLHDSVEVFDNQQTAVDLGSFMLDGGVANTHFDVWNYGSDWLYVTDVTAGLLTVDNTPQSLYHVLTYELACEIDPVALGVGIHNDTISITSNDPEENPFEIPVTFEITPPPVEPDIAVLYDSAEVQDGQPVPVNLGQFPVDGPSPQFTFLVENQGSAALNISGLGLPVLYEPPINDGLLTTIAEGASDEFTFTLDVAGYGLGVKTDQITIDSDDPDEGTFTIPLTFEVVPPLVPEIVVEAIFSAPEPTVYNGLGIQVDVGVYEPLDLDLGTDLFVGDDPFPHIIIIGNPGTDSLLTDPPVIRDDQGQVVANGAGPLSYDYASAPYWIGLPPTHAEIPAGDSTGFELYLHTDAPVSLDGWTIELTNNDPDDNPFVIPISGDVLPVVTVPEIVVEALFTPHEPTIHNGLGLQVDIDQYTPLDLDQGIQLFVGDEPFENPVLIGNAGNDILLTDAPVIYNDQGQVVPAGAGPIDVMFYDSNYWVGEPPTHAELPPTEGTSFDLVLLTDAPVSLDGWYVELTTNDADDNPFVIPISGDVLPVATPPEILVEAPHVPADGTLYNGLGLQVDVATYEPLDLDWGSDVFVGDGAWITPLPISNMGDDILSVDLPILYDNLGQVVPFGLPGQGPLSLSMSIQYDPLWIGTPATHAEIPAEETTTALEIILNTNEALSLDGWYIELTTNDPDDNPFVIPISGDVLPVPTPPDVQVNLLETGHEPFPGTPEVISGLGADVGNGLEPLDVGMHEYMDVAPTALFEVSNAGGGSLYVSSVGVYDDQGVRVVGSAVSYYAPAWDSEPIEAHLDAQNPSAMFLVTIPTDVPRDLTGYSIQFATSDPDPDEEEFKIPLTGEILGPPTIWVDQTIDYVNYPVQSSVGVHLTPGSWTPVDLGVAMVGDDPWNHHAEFIITNTGASTLLLDTPVIYDGQGSDVSWEHFERTFGPAGWIFDGYSVLGGELAPGETAGFVVEMQTDTPIFVDDWTVTIGTNDPAAGNFEIPIVGEVLEPYLAPEVSVFLFDAQSGSIPVEDGLGIYDGWWDPVHFGDTMVGAQPEPSLTFTIYNDGDDLLALSEPYFTNDYGLWDDVTFTYGNAWTYDGYGWQATLASGASTTLTATFATQQPVDLWGDASISFATNDADENPFDIPISGYIEPVYTEFRFEGEWYSDVWPDGPRDEWYPGEVLDFGTWNAGEPWPWMVFEVDYWGHDYFYLYEPEVYDPTGEPSDIINFGYDVALPPGVSGWEDLEGTWECTLQANPFGDYPGYTDVIAQVNTLEPVNLDGYTIVWGNSSNLPGYDPLVIDLAGQVMPRNDGIDPELAVVLQGENALALELNDDAGWTIEPGVYHDLSVGHWMEDGDTGGLLFNLYNTGGGTLILQEPEIYDSQGVRQWDAFSVTLGQNWQFESSTESWQVSINNDPVSQARVILYPNSDVPVDLHGYSIFFPSNEPIDAPALVVDSELSDEVVLFNGGPGQAGLWVPITGGVYDADASSDLDVFHQDGATFLYPGGVDMEITSELGIWNGSGYDPVDLGDWQMGEYWPEAHFTLTNNGDVPIVVYEPNVYSPSGNLSDVEDIVGSGLDYAFGSTPAWSLGVHGHEVTLDPGESVQFAMQMWTDFGGWEPDWTDWNISVPYTAADMGLGLGMFDIPLSGSVASRPYGGEETNIAMMSEDLWPVAHDFEVEFFNGQGYLAGPGTFAPLDPTRSGWINADGDPVVEFEIVNYGGTDAVLYEPFLVDPDGAEVTGVFSIDLYESSPSWQDGPFGLQAVPQPYWDTWIALVFDGTQSIDLEGHSLVFDNDDLDAPAFVIPMAGVLEGDGTPEITVHWTAEPDTEITDGVGIDTNDDGSADVPIFVGSTEQDAAQLVGSFVITNDGDDTLDLGAVTVSGPFTYLGGLDQPTLAPGESDTIQVALPTDQVGAASGTVTINSNDADEAVFDFTISGEITAPPIVPPEIEVALNGAVIADGQTTVLDFGTLLQGAGGNSLVFTVENLGQEDLTLSGLTVPAGFSITDPLADTLGEGESDTFTVTLDTSAVGEFSGTVTFTNNDEDETPFDFPIAGEIVAPEIVVSLDGSGIGDGQDLAVNFGLVRLDTGTGMTRVFRVENTGNSALSLGSVSLPNGYTLVEPLSNSLAPGEFDTFSVQLNNSGQGTKTGSISFANSDNDENPFNFPITGVVGAPEITVLYDGSNVADDQAAAIGFGANDINFTGATRDFTVRNDGEFDLNLGIVAVPQGYEITDGLQGVLEPGQSDVFTVRILTDTLGVYSGQIGFGTNDPNEDPFNIAITGSVVTPEITVLLGGSSIADGETNPVSFGDILLGSPVEQRVFTVRNDGTQTLTLTTPSLPAGYTLVEPLAGSLAPGAADTFTVQLDTETTGVKQGEIIFANNDNDENPFNFTIAGAVLQPAPLESNTGWLEGESGERILVTLSGPGLLEVYTSSEDPTIIDRVVVTDGTRASSLMILSIGAGQTRVGEVIVNGSLGMINAPQSLIEVGINATESVDSFMLDDIAPEAVIQTNTWTMDGVNFLANDIGDGTSIDISGRVNMFRAGTFGQGSLTAGCFRQVAINMGDFDVDLTANMGSVGTVLVNGDICGRILAECNVNQLMTPGGTIKATVRGYTIGTIMAQTMEGAILSSREDIEFLMIGGDIIDSHILAGYDIGVDGQIGAGDTLTDGDVEFMFFGGELRNTHVALGVAPVYSPLFGSLPSGGASSGEPSWGYILGNGVATDNGGQKFGFYFDGDAESSIVSNLTPQDDFVILYEV